jgi:hypothetical protein
VSGPREFQTITQGPSGRGYRLWANGDGVEVFREDGARMHDVGSHVPIIPLVDVPIVAAMLDMHAKATS